ncbi:hypothetical protein PGT21_028722 [Puccinia graminis f. sp. tritici]|uniref:Uncharacterized protein n=1 Tax=Puccinia graminis f. sp. tritici TaxID=56615 RepID=A0A5B0PVB5_PUCGR|nr:hypothetical protein PGT21_028722 [Puccinia graminis f. sp. tritici]
MGGRGRKKNRPLGDPDGPTRLVCLIFFPAYLSHASPAFSSSCLCNLNPSSASTAPCYLRNSVIVYTSVLSRKLLYVFPNMFLSSNIVVFLLLLHHGLLIKE